MASSEVLSSDGGWLLGVCRLGQVRTICHHSKPLCGRVSVATSSAVAIVRQGSMAHIFIAGLLRVSKQKQIDTYKLYSQWAHMTHFEQTKKNISPCWKSWEKIGLHGDKVPQCWCGPLNSNQMQILESPSTQAESPFAWLTHIKQFVCQFTCHFNGCLFPASFVWINRITNHHWFIITRYSNCLSVRESQFNSNWPAEKRKKIASSRTGLLMLQCCSQLKLDFKSLGTTWKR